MCQFQIKVHTTVLVSWKFQVKLNVQIKYRQVDYVLQLKLFFLNSWCNIAKYKKKTNHKWPIELKR